jgi:hypothetical protein
VDIEQLTALIKARIKTPRAELPSRVEAPADVLRPVIERER